ncbi:hypothetical protein [Chamaesiphon minutus]|uniref:Uncharacterized protein n=1 Tax=Chamaesiphon minutus (strain ATCC 27169 / PCC 6605) TaxID=1173020 RepID=K9UHS1_CHAP6|nr:hypothetical protein [Chamaesiphon minutus]AFY93749.1 hypothetical protein Cha6605_2709 [Chamaesiphon minutus PCC 6605]
MESIKIRQHIGDDGILHLDLPVGLIGREIEVMVIYQPVRLLTSSDRHLVDLYGICADDPIIIDDRGISEVLDDDLVGAFD